MYIYKYTRHFSKRASFRIPEAANPSSRSEKWAPPGDHQRAAALAGGGSPHWLCAAGCSGGGGDWVDRARSPGGNLWGSKGEKVRISSGKMVIFELKKESFW